MSDQVESVRLTDELGAAKWTEINIPFGQVWTDSFVEGDSFVKRGLNLPGTLVQMGNGKTYLIGHLNEDRGVCDDYVAFSRSEIVVRYRVVWSEKQLTAE